MASVSHALPSKHLVLLTSHQVLQLLLPGVPCSSHALQRVDNSVPDLTTHQAHKPIPSLCNFAAKKPEDQLFDSIDAQDLNKTLKDCMEGLSAKVPLPCAA